MDNDKLDTCVSAYARWIACFSRQVSLSFWYKKDQDDMVGLVGNGGCETDTVPSIYVLGLYQGFVQGAMFNGDKDVAYGSKRVVSLWNHIV